MKRNASAGFTLVEILMVMAVSVVMAGIAIPISTNAMKSFDQTATVSAVGGAISATRFQAIMHGYPYQLVLDTASLSYQVYNEVPPAASFSLVVPGIGSSITPLPSAGEVTLTGVTCSVPLTNWVCTPASDLQTLANQTITYTFLANGTVTTTPAGVGMKIANSVKSNTLWVSGVGDVGTSSP